jgi:hypothetical protein
MLSVESRCKPCFSTDCTKAAGLLWEQRVLGSNPSAPTIPLFQFSFSARPPALPGRRMLLDVGPSETRGERPVCPRFFQTFMTTVASDGTSVTIQTAVDSTGALSHYDPKN